MSHANTPRSTEAKCVLEGQPGVAEPAPEAVNLQNGLTRHADGFDLTVDSNGRHQEILKLRPGQNIFEPQKDCNPELSLSKSRAKEGADPEEV